MNPVEIFVLSHNNEATLAETLESAFAQTYPHKKIILSDDASTDRSLEMARPFVERGLEIRAQPNNIGQVANYNQCFQSTKAPFVAIFHGDDLYEPEFIEKQVRFLESLPEADASLTAGTVIGPKNEIFWNVLLPPGLQHPLLSANEVFEFILQFGNSFLLCPSAMFRAASIQKLGGFREEFPISPDLEIWLRILFRGSGLGFINDPLLRYRYSTDQLTSTYESRRLEPSEFFKVMDSYLKDFPVSPEIRQAYEALRHLDLIQVGLNRLSHQNESKPLQDALEWFCDPAHQKFNKNFGFVDRLKIKGAQALAPIAATRFGPPLARFLSRKTDPRTSNLLRLALKLKRSLNAKTSLNP